MVSKFIINLRRLTNKIEFVSESDIENLEQLRIEHGRELKEFIEATIKNGDKQNGLFKLLAEFQELNDEFEYTEVIVRSRLKELWEEGKDDYDTTYSNTKEVAINLTDLIDDYFDLWITYYPENIFKNREIFEKYEQFISKKQKLRFRQIISEINSKSGLEESKEERKKSLGLSKENSKLSSIQELVIDGLIKSEQMSGFESIMQNQHSIERIVWDGNLAQVCLILEWFFPEKKIVDIVEIAERCFSTETLAKSESVSQKISKYRKEISDTIPLVEDRIRKGQNVDSLLTPLVNNHLKLKKIFPDVELKWVKNLSE